MRYTISTCYWYHCIAYSVADLGDIVCSDNAKSTDNTLLCNVSDKKRFHIHRNAFSNAEDDAAIICGKLNRWRPPCPIAFLAALLRLYIANGEAAVRPYSSRSTRRGEFDYSAPCESPGHGRSSASTISSPIGTGDSVLEAYRNADSATANQTSSCHLMVLSGYDSAPWPHRRSTAESV